MKCLYFCYIYLFYGTYYVGWVDWRLQYCARSVKQPQLSEKNVILCPKEPQEQNFPAQCKCLDAIPQRITNAMLANNHEPPNNPNPLLPKVRMNEMKGGLKFHTCAYIRTDAVLLGWIHLSGFQQPSCSLMGCTSVSMTVCWGRKSSELQKVWVVTGAWNQVVWPL